METTCPKSDPIEFGRGDPCHECPMETTCPKPASPWCSTCGTVGFSGTPASCEPGI